MKTFNGHTLAEIKKRIEQNAPYYWPHETLAALVAEIERIDLEIWNLGRKNDLLQSQVDDLRQRWVKAGDIFVAERDAQCATARRDTLRQVRQWCEDHVPGFADLGCTKTNFQRLSWPLLRAELDRLDGSPAEPTESIAAYVQRQQEWSSIVFGWGRRREGILKHIEKEITEIREASTENEPEEWIDVVILALDGAWRSGLSAEGVADLLLRKQLKNFARQWPTSAPEGDPIEHIREPEPTTHGVLSQEELDEILAEPEQRCEDCANLAPVTDAGRSPEGGCLLHAVPSCPCQDFEMQPPPADPEKETPCSTPSTASSETGASFSASSSGTSSATGTAGEAAADAPLTKKETAMLNGSIILFAAPVVFEGAPFPTAGYTPMPVHDRDSGYPMRAVLPVRAVYVEGEDLVTALDTAGDLMREGEVVLNTVPASDTPLTEKETPCGGSTEPTGSSATIQTSDREPGRESSSGPSSASSVLSSGGGTADAPLPPAGMHLLPKGDGYEVKEGERFYCFNWIGADAHVGEVTYAGYWYAAPDPPDWPALPPNARRINAWDVPMEGDLFFYGLETWTVMEEHRTPYLFFRPDHMNDGRYARPLPEPPAELVDAVGLTAAEVAFLHNLATDDIRYCWCPQCGPAEIDEDGLCNECGATGEICTPYEIERRQAVKDCVEPPTEECVDLEPSAEAPTLTDRALDYAGKIHVLAERMDRIEGMVERLIQLNTVGLPRDMRPVNDEYVISDKASAKWLRTGDTGQETE